MRDGLNAPHAKQETLQNLGPLRLEAGLQENSLCISDCGIRSGFTVQEEQEEMLFFSLLSVSWTNID